jgi:hypothetical protein
VGIGCRALECALGASGSGNVAIGYLSLQDQVSAIVLG